MQEDLKVKSLIQMPFGLFALNFTLMLAILIERLNPEFGEGLRTEYEDIDHFLTLISSKTSKSYDFGRNWGQIMIDIFIFSWPIFSKLWI